MSNEEQDIRVRVAPSPTGNLHVGTARVALFNELFARKHNGVFILRLDDTDRQRSKKEYEDDIIEGLTWLGLKWNEGPFRQSERGALYTKAIQTLLDEDKAYQEDSAVILKVEPQSVSFDDAVRGKLTVHTDSFEGNFVIARAIEDPLYHLAAVVDDADMNITHVLRGEDHLHNTAKHILLQRALGYEQPVYAHLPLLLDENRAKLSKRSGEVSVLAYRDRGYLPEAMLNYLALLGWNPKDNREFFTHEELAEAFSLEGIQKGGAIFSMHKLESINKHYIRELSADELYKQAGPYLEQKGIVTDDCELLKKALATEQERVSTLAELPDTIQFFLQDWEATYQPQLLVWKKSTPEATHKLLEQLVERIESIKESTFNKESLEQALLSWIDDNNLGRGDTLWPMRVALTGQEHSPGPFEVAAILGKEETIKRLTVALKKLE